MKISVIFSLFIFLSACGHKHNAFEKFHISHEKELSEDILQTLKVKRSDQSVAGMVTVVYLNKVFPKRYKDGEYFYIYYYIKNPHSSIAVTLNGAQPLEVQHLPVNNQFSYLTSFDASWSRYILVKFAKEGNRLQLKFTADKAAVATLQFVKDK